MTEFDVLYFDLKGNLIWKTTFNHGDEKNYKHVFEPTTAFLINNKLVFLNSNRKSVFNIDYEVISIADKSEKQVLLSDESNTIFAKTEYVNNYIPETGHVLNDGKNFWIYDFGGEKPEGQADFFYKTMSIVKLDSDFKPVIKKIIPINSSKKVLPTMEFLSNEGGNIKYLLQSGGVYSVLTFGGEKGFDNEVIKSDLFINYSKDTITAFGKSYIIDRDTKTIYLLHQAYNTGNGNYVLNKILITKISY